MPARPVRGGKGGPSTIPAGMMPPAMHWCSQLGVPPGGRACCQKGVSPPWKGGHPYGSQGSGESCCSGGGQCMMPLVVPGGWPAFPGGGSPVWTVAMQQKGGWPSWKGLPPPGMEWGGGGCGGGGGQCGWHCGGGGMGSGKGIMPLVMHPTGSLLGGCAGGKGRPPHGMEWGGGGSGGGESCPGPPGQGASPVLRFAAVWNLDPAFYVTEAVLWKSLVAIDLEPFALAMLPGVPGAFVLEYNDLYSAASLVFALDRVDLKRTLGPGLGPVMVAQEGMDVRAAEWHPGRQWSFHDDELPSGLRLAMRKLCLARIRASHEDELLAATAWLRPPLS